MKQSSITSSLKSINYQSQFTAMETAEKKNIARIKSQLPSFTGTSQYYRYGGPFYRFNYTDGVKYVTEECKAMWMLDVIASYQFTRTVAKHKFQIFKFEKNGDDSSIDLTVMDGDMNELETQHIEYTDFPLDEITFWLIDGVAILPSEY